MLVSTIHQHESAIGKYMSSPSWASLPPSISSHPSRLSQRQIGATWITQKFHWQSILYMTIHMFQGYSLNLSHSLIPLLCPQICSIFLCLECCSADRFISIIFLDFLCVCVQVCVSQSVMSGSLRPHRLYLARFLCPWNSSGKNTRVDCHSFLQGIFLTQGSNLGLLHYRQIFYCLSH